MTAKTDSKPYGIVYCITNTVNGKKYIGQTVGSVTKRWKNHISDRTGCRLLKNAIAKYGVDSFNVQTIGEAACAEALNDLETQLIVENNTRDRALGYNLNPGGRSGKQHPETVAKRAEALRGRPLSEDHCRKLSEAHMGHTRSEQSRLKQSSSMMGAKRPKTKEHIAKIAAANRGQKRGPMTAEHKAKIGAANFGKVHGPLSVAHREKIAAAQRGVPKVVSPEAKIRMAEMLRNRVLSAETIKKMSDSHKGKAQPKEAVDKRAAAHRGRKNTEETKQKMSDAAKGVAKSDAHRASLRAASKLRWERYRLEKAAQI